MQQQKQQQQTNNKTLSPKAFKPHLIWSLQLDKVGMGTELIRPSVNQRNEKE